VVVNHHLLCADLAVKESSYGAVIPEYDTLIVDEAHLLEDVATQYFGQQLSVHRFEDLCRDVERELKAAALDAREVLARGGVAAPPRGRVLPLLAQEKGLRLRARWMSPRIGGGASALAHAPGRPADAHPGHARPARAARRRSRRTATSRRARASCAPPRRTRTSTSSRRAAAVVLRRPHRRLAVLQEQLFAACAPRAHLATLAVDGGFDY
jgi:hypothetical protein